MVWLALSWFNWQCKVVFYRINLWKWKESVYKETNGQWWLSTKFTSFKIWQLSSTLSWTLSQCNSGGKGSGKFLLTFLKSVILQFIKNFILGISLKERAKFKVLIKVVFFDSFIILSKIRVSVSYLFHEIILIRNNTLPESFFFPKCFLTSYNTELTMAKGSPFLSTILVGTLK